MDWLLNIAACVTVLVVAAALIEAYLKRNKKRRLSDMRPDPDSLKRRPWAPDGVTKVNDIDRVHKKNQNLEEWNWRKGLRHIRHK